MGTSRVGSVGWQQTKSGDSKEVQPEIVLVFLSVESETNILYVNINFTGNLLLGFGRYCGKVLPEPAVFHLF